MKGQLIIDPASATTTTYRLTFENDYDGLAKLAGAIDISNLKREGKPSMGGLCGQQGQSRA